MEIYSLGLVRSLPIPIKELLLMAISQNGFLFVQVSVPQGSVLGPLLFLLYIDEIHHVISNSTVKLFADDIALYKQIISTHDETLLQEDLTKVYQWSQLW